jgi:hypothetical protein
LSKAFGTLALSLDGTTGASRSGLAFLNKG